MIKSLRANDKNSLLSFRKTIHASDRAVIRRIVRETGYFSTAEEEIAVELVDERIARGARSGYEFLFAERAGEVIGYACFGRIPATQDSFDLYWIAVHPDFQGKGAGRELLAASEASIGKAGGRRIYADTSSRGQYASTRRFYETCGFWQEACLPDFYAPGESKIIYVKDIP